MSSSSTPGKPSNPFMKPRRAYVACAQCRKRKIKCVSVSDIDYRPCTRCAAKGLKCEYFAVPEDDNISQADIPPPEFQASRHPQQGWAPQPITPPSAGINEYLSSSSSRRASRSGAVPPPTGPPRYPYQPKSTHSGMAAPSQTGQTPSAPAQHAGYPHSQHGFASMHQQPHPGAAAPQYYPSTTPYQNPGNVASFSNYNSNYGQTYVPLQSGGAAYPWPQAM
ncbi:hypothetical protein C8F04DRAFT_1254389 [Mycena alexandri]|uniref:Zn(2)-C6 fungal-type domain-containing protein n=1 Tax=Mycena alexandri TaxID=1745969 RepID=A0AAD6T541_9AGAR|nr:hypothetical protein C8F04DRAFT_1270184 [Mycena alexandri]KAJ7039949.1 hypothetical protein C8F04DRAFT_1254389 [Mycena alexandri]